jgi:hypothetical protein
MESLEVRLDKAVKAIRKAGITARKNVMGCCRSCVNLGIADNAPVVWHYGGQGNRLSVSGDWANAESIYFNHDNLATEAGLTSAGEIVLKAFEDNGLAVDWDRSPHKCLEIVLK